MKRLRFVFALVALASAALLLAACDGDEDSTPTATVPATGTPTSTPMVTATPEPRFTIEASNAAGLAEAASVATEGVNRLVWAADSSALLVDGGAGVVRYGVPDLDVLAEYLPAGVLVLGVSSDGSTAAILDGDAVQLVDVTTQEVVSTLMTRGSSSSAVFYDGGARVAVASNDEILVSLWDVLPGAQIGALGGFDTAAPVYSLVLSEDGAWAAWVSRGTLQFQQIESGESGALGERLQFEDFIGQAVFAPDGSSLATITGVDHAGALAGLLQLWDPETAEELLSLTGASLFSAVAYSPDGALLAVGTETGVTFYSAADGAELGSLTIAEQPFRVVAFSPAGDMLATVDDSQTLRLWQVPGE